MPQPVPPVVKSTDERVLEAVLPINRNGFAIAAGYVALFSIFAIPAPVAVILGIIALKHLKSTPQKLGRGRAWFAIICGGIFTLLWLLFLIDFSAHL